MSYQASSDRADSPTAPATHPHQKNLDEFSRIGVFPDSLSKDFPDSPILIISR